MLELILIKYFDLPQDWNDDYEKEKDIWNKSYSKLVNLIYDLEDLGVLYLNESNKIIDCLDMISNMEE